MSGRDSPHAAAADGRKFSVEEALEIESDRWRRVVAAFLLGAEARSDRALRPWHGLLGGIGLTAAIVVLIGVIGVASATLAANSTARPSPTAPVTVPSPTPNLSTTVKPSGSLNP